MCYVERQLMRQVTGSTLTTYIFLVSKMYVYTISWQTPANLEISGMGMIVSTGSVLVVDSMVITLLL